MKKHLFFLYAYEGVNPMILDIEYEFSWKSEFGCKPTLKNKNESQWLLFLWGFGFTQQKGSRGIP